MPVDGRIDDEAVEVPAPAVPTRDHCRDDATFDVADEQSLRVASQQLPYRRHVGPWFTTLLVGASPVLARGQRMRLTSPAFAPGTMIPTGFTCDDQDVPPPLRWSGLPAPTVELALTVEDLDTPGRTFVHWVGVGDRPRQWWPARRGRARRRP